MSFDTVRRSREYDHVTAQQYLRDRRYLQQYQQHPMALHTFGLAILIPRTFV